MTIDISVIIPVYNASLYLRECIESVLNQSKKELEIIFVDDGSTDDSVSIIEDYMRTDKRIILLKQENQYAGVARNKGLKIAKGKYVIFLDSDDFFELQMLDKLYSKAEKNNAEIIMFGYWLYDNVSGENSKVDYRYLCRNKVSSNDLGRKIFELTEPVPWNKLFLREFIVKNGLYFQSVKNGNDEFFNRASVLCAERMFFIKKRFVHYRYNNDKSLQGSLKKEYESVKCGIDIISELKQFMIERKYLDNKEFRLAYEQYACNMLTYRVRYCISNFKLFEILYSLIKDKWDELEIKDDDSWNKNGLMRSIIESKNVSDFYCLYISFLHDDYVPRNSREYTVGKKCLYIPYKIRKLLK